MPRRITTEIIEIDDKNNNEIITRSKKRKLNNNNIILKCKKQKFTDEKEDIVSNLNSNDLINLDNGKTNRKIKYTDDDYDDDYDDDD